MKHIHSIIRLAPDSGGSYSSNSGSSGGSDSGSNSGSISSPPSGSPPPGSPPPGSPPPGSPPPGSPPPGSPPPSSGSSSSNYDPTATIDKPAEAIEVEGKWVAGVGIKVTFKATITDKDKVNGIDKDDTFNKLDAILWSEENNKGSLAKFKTDTMTFTATEPGDYVLILKVKDDATDTHVQDFNELMEIKRVTISIVHPDGIRAKTVTPGKITGNEFGGFVANGNVTWQVTYKTKDLERVMHFDERWS